MRLKGTESVTQTDAHGRFRFAHSDAARRVTAWKEGYLIGGARLASPLAIRLVALPAEDHDSYEWVDPAANPAQVHNCANCHAEIYHEWSHSGHGRSAADAAAIGTHLDLDWFGVLGIARG